MTFEKVLDMHEDDVKKHFNNNFVDIIVDTKWSLNFPFSTFSEDMSGYRKLDFLPRLTNVEDEDGSIIENVSTDIEQIDILELSSKVVYNTQHSDVIKEKLVSTIRTLYEKVQKNQNEKNNEN